MTQDDRTVPVLAGTGLRVRRAERVRPAVLTTNRQRARRAALAPDARRRDGLLAFPTTACLSARESSDR